MFSQFFIYLGCVHPKCCLIFSLRQILFLFIWGACTLNQCFPTSGSRPIDGSRSYFRCVAKHF